MATSPRASAASVVCEFPGDIISGRRKDGGIKGTFPSVVIATTKSEIRISKSETNPNEKNSKFETISRAGLENLGIGILHLFRASDFGFK
jgi:hypothetical protein